MKHIIAPLIAIICIVAGSIGGNFLKSRPAGDAGSQSHMDTSETSSHGEKEDGHGSDGSEKEGHGSDSYGSTGTGDIVYYKFSREFVVPILRNERVQSLVILNINLEANSDISQELYSMEPKIRDNIMTTLIELSNDGVTFESITDVDSYESIRAMIMKNLNNVIPSGINNVLILDVARQDL